MSSKFKLFFPCYFAFLVNGAMVLLVGAILPYIIDEAGINYSVAGGLLSAFAIGNLLASFVNPVLAGKIGRKATIVSMCLLIPTMLFVITLLPPVPVMYAAFILIGIGRGSVSIINNAVVNDNSDGKPAALNLLHMTFAVGAFLAPFLTSLYVNMGLGWRAIVYTIIAGSSLACLFYALMKLDYNWPKDSKKGKKEAGQSENADESRAKPFYKSGLFYIMGLLLFLYLGLENCVNGWFVTYFKSMGIMSDTYATNLVSVTWVMVMLGRLLTAKLSTKINKNVLILTNCIATAVFFFLLIATKNLAVITVAIAGLGFFFAGIYPTTVSAVGKVIKGSNTGMSMFLAIAALGGIVTPQIIGVVADGMGMVAAIVILALNATGMLIMAFVNMKINRQNA
ncbi:MAG: MFS transporter [Lachnospira sp.]|nr:MFS transporter [Lachnospira sp.]